jgi:hypothetical protein
MHIRRRRQQRKPRAIYSTRGGNGAMITGLAWYIGPLKMQVAEEINRHPRLLQRLGRYKTKFIDWAVNQRVIYEGNLAEEIASFEERFIFCRLENIDLGLWRETRKRIFNRDNYTCVHCGKRGGILEIDHIIPVSKHGSNYDHNLATSCRTCNRRKKDKVFTDGAETE